MSSAQPLCSFAVLRNLRWRQAAFYHEKFTPTFHPPCQEKLILQQNEIPTPLSSCYFCARPFKISIAPRWKCSIFHVKSETYVLRMKSWRLQTKVSFSETETAESWTNHKISCVHDHFLNFQHLSTSQRSDTVPRKHRHWLQLGTDGLQKVILKVSVVYFLLVGDDLSWDQSGSLW